MDLGVCVEAIRRAIVYGNDLLEYRKHPRRIRKSTARLATDGFLVAMKAIADNCPLPDYLRASLLEDFYKYKNSSWEALAEYKLPEHTIWSTIDLALTGLRDELGYNPDKYEKYVELASEI